MKLSELIEELQDIQEDLDSVDPEVILAIQPSYPLAVSLKSVVDPYHIDYDKDAYKKANEETDERGPHIWLVAGNQKSKPYAPKELFDGY